MSAGEASGIASFVVRLNGAITQNVTVKYTTTDGTAAAPSDYTATSETLTFTPSGLASQIVSVTLVNDAVSEPTETFTLSLSNASANALISDADGIASIINDDASITINDVNVTEGNVNRKGVATNTTATFTVSLAHPVNRVVLVNYATGAFGDTATAGADYQSNSSSLSIPTGQTSGSVAVTVIGDNLVEPNETFSVVISSSDTVTDNTGIGTILDNDSGCGKGGGKPGAAAANYVGDFTDINHTDLSEFSSASHDHTDLGDSGSVFEHSRASGSSGATSDDVASGLTSLASLMFPYRQATRSVFDSLKPNDFSRLGTLKKPESRLASVLSSGQRGPLQTDHVSQLQKGAILHGSPGKPAHSSAVLDSSDELFSNVGGILHSLLSESEPNLVPKTDRQGTMEETSDESVAPETEQSQVSGELQL